MPHIRILGIIIGLVAGGAGIWGIWLLWNIGLGGMADSFRQDARSGRSAKAACQHSLSRSPPDRTAADSGCARIPREAKNDLQQTLERHAVIDDINRRTMASADAVRMYASLDELTPPERVIFERLRQETHGRPILELGVGGGRTVSPLLAMSRDYVGIDYTPAMVGACRRRFPDVRFEIADARNLSGYADGQFKLVVFSCNGLCMVGDADRMQIMREVCRVLANDGVFVFSTYNQGSSDHSAGLVLPEFIPSNNPARLVWRALRFARDAMTHTYNYMRYSRHDFRSPEYSMINDRCHSYATMLYYIDMPHQRRQLIEAGFLPCALAYGMQGEPVGDDTLDSSIAFVARKDPARAAVAPES